MSFSLIAAVGRRGELGKGNELIFRLKDDMKFFRETTKNHKVVMGSKTFASIGRPLPNRENFVLTRHPDALPSSVNTLTSFENALTRFENTDEKIFVIGGASVYAQFLPFAKEILLTEIDAEEKDADAFFPEFDKEKFSRKVLKSGTEDGLKYEIVKYERKN